MLKKALTKLKYFLYIVCVILGVVALSSYNPLDSSLTTVGGQTTHNILGIYGSYFADFCFQWVGFSAWFLLFAVFVHAVRCLFGRDSRHIKTRACVLFLLFLLSSYLLGDIGKGGVLGSFFYRSTLYYLPLWLSVCLWSVFTIGCLWLFYIPIRRILLFIISKMHIKKSEKLEKVLTPKPKASKPKKETTKTASGPSVAKKEKNSGYNLPPVTLLDEAKTQNTITMTKEAKDRISSRIETVLRQFRVDGRIVRVSPGPVVTLYEFEPAPGIKIERVIGLADNIAMAMKVVSVRMAAVPASGLIGIEVPNENRQMVYVRELMSSSEFKDHKGILPIILGKDIGGTATFADLATMPHLLVAGTTGSGKSVGINTMILSLLYRFTPAECRFIMVDPKMLELSVYEGIPHLLTPVVTESGKAVVALKWAVREMENRYRAMAELGTRNIDSYNKRLKEAKEKNENLTQRVRTGFDPETGQPIITEKPIDLTPMPYIVIIIDEVSDLMDVARKDVEVVVRRLAQMARAAGIHLVMATQRPSVDVITGTIKANLPTRISFQLGSKIDSQTILERKGAEQLLGKGDMLYLATGKKPVRLHGPFVSDTEIARVVDFWKSQGKAQYVEAVVQDDENPTDDDDGPVFDRSSMGGNSSGGDDLYQQAVSIVLQNKRPTTSYIQRQLQIGYNKAANLIERMEREGIVSKASATGRREILIQKKDSE